MRRYILLSTFLASAATVAAQPMISVNPTSHDYGSLDVGSSANQTVRVQNSGNEVLEASTSMLVGTHFSVSPLGSFEVQPGAFQDLIVTFAPIRAGSQGDSLYIAHNAGNAGSPVAVWLTGVGIPKAAISVDPGALNFGGVAVRTTRDDTVMVRNIGSGDLAVQATVDQGGPTFALITTSGAFTIPVGGSSAVIVRYTPPNVGNHSGRLRIEHNGTNTTTPILVPLSGSGTQASTFDPYEPNDSAPSATPVDVGFVSDSTEIWPTNDVDYFAFEGVYGEWIRIRCDIVPGSTLNGKIWLYDSSGILLAENDNAGGSSSRSEINDTLRAAGTYYLRVAFAGNPGIGYPYEPASKGAGEDPIGEYKLSIVRTGSDPLGTPTLITPPDNAFDEKVTPDLAWTAVPGAKVYDIAVARTVGFAPGTIVYQSSRTGTSVTTSELPAGTSLFWHVRAGNELGAGSFSAPRSFQTTFAPVVVNPLPDVLLASGSRVVDLAPVFTDPEGGALRYRVVTVIPAGLVNTFVQGSQLTLTQVGDGYADVTVGATDPKDAETTNTFRVAAGTATDTQDDELPAAEFGIGANYPNPFWGRTTVPVSLTESSDVRLSLFDLRGSEIRVLASGRMSAGTHEIDVTSAGLASGVYLVRFEAQGKVAVSSIIVAP